MAVAAVVLRQRLLRHRRRRLSAQAEILAGFEEDIQTYGIGSIGELFNADPPFAPRGAISQAWSVAAVLDIYGMILARNRKERPESRKNPQKKRIKDCEGRKKRW